MHRNFSNFGFNQLDYTEYTVCIAVIHGTPQS